MMMALQCINKVNNPTMKADIRRYLVVWELGGVYNDIDIGCTKKFHHLVLFLEDLYVYEHSLLSNFE